MSDQRETVRRGYDAIAADYAAARSDESNARPLLDTLRERLPADARVLDAGCGDGHPVLAALDRFDRVGLDLSNTQLRRASRQVSAELVRGDLAALPFAADAFDAVTAFHSVIHVPTEDHPEAFREFARVLRPGGWLLATVGDEAWAGANDDWLDTGVRMEWSFPSMTTTREHLSDAGFVVENSWTVDDELGGEFPFLLCRRRA